MELMPKNASLIVALVLCGGLTAPARAADDPVSRSPECCQRENAQIARWQQNADRLYARFKPREAAGELQKVLTLDPANFAALIKLARAYIDIGDHIAENGSDSKERKMKEYIKAEDYARRAVKVDPSSTWGHFWVAASLGNIAMVSPVEKQLDLAGDIRDAVEESIACDPQNGLAYHIYGVWHRKLAELSQGQRILAGVFYGRSPPSGSLQKSIEYLKKAVELNPTVILSRLELARSYIAVRDFADARALLNSVPALPIQFSDDAKHKEESAQLLQQIQDS
jgi:tetratricopeptide (TPR) repeat protein